METIPDLSVYPTIYEQEAIRFQWKEIEESTAHIILIREGY